jgi:hypothetical protein
MFGAATTLLSEQMGGALVIDHDGVALDAELFVIKQYSIV